MPELCLRHQQMAEPQAQVVREPTVRVVAVAVEPQALQARHRQIF
jgi:hypothetical protein